MKPNAYAAACPTRQILDRIGDKWAVLILILIRDEPMRFNALRRTIEGISQKMLSQVLKSLERDGLIKRRVFATVPVTVEYSITPLGQTLAAAVDPLRDWAEQNLKEVLSAQRCAEECEGGVRHTVIARSTCDEAIHASTCGAMDCFASLAMTKRNHKARLSLNPPRLGEFDLDAQFDLGQHRIQSGIAGGRLQVGRGIAQAVHGGSIEIAGQEPDLEIVEHIECAPAALHRSLAALDRILLDALQREQRIDIGGGLRRRGRTRLGRCCHVRQREGRGRRPARAIRRCPQRGAVRSVDAHRDDSAPDCRNHRPPMVNDA
jgi:DNA-binding HxlR family transcriptional regulator